MLVILFTMKGSGIAGAEKSGICGGVACCWYWFTGLYGSVETGGDWEGADLFGDGTSEVLNVPYLSSDLCNTAAASSGKSTFHFRARTLMMESERRAQSQSSAISSRCLMPWVMSLFAVFSGKLSMCMVHAEWTM